MIFLMLRPLFPIIIEWTLGSIDDFFLDSALELANYLKNSFLGFISIRFKFSCDGDNFKFSASFLGS